MPDYTNRVLKWIDHNRWLTIATLTLAAGVGVQSGCESTTLFHGEKVTRPQLESQIITESAAIKAAYAQLDAQAAALAEQGKLAKADLDAQDAKNQAILSTLGNLALSAATGGATTPTLVTGGVTLASILLGGGALIDNRRKDKVIASVKNT